MTRRWIMAVAAASLLPGNAWAAERRFALASFDAVRVEGDVAVEIVSGASPGAVASGEPQALDALSIEVQGRTLHIRRARTDAPIERRARRTTPEALPLVRIAARSVESLGLKGHGSVRLDRLAGTRPSARVDGDGSAEIGHVNAETIATTVTGGGSLKISGRVQTGRMMMLGDGLVDASHLDLSALDFTGEGPVRARLLVHGPARLVANGDSDISVAGKPDCKVRQTGKGRIDCGGEAPLPR